MTTTQQHNSTLLLMVTKLTTLEPISNEESIRVQTKFYIIVSACFFIFFFGVIGYVFYNQWKRVQEINREVKAANDIEKSGKPMLSRKESVVGQGQKVVIIERKLSRVKRATSMEEEESEKKCKTSTSSSESNHTLKNYHKLKSQYPNQPVMVRYVNGITPKIMTDYCDFNSLENNERMNNLDVNFPAEPGTNNMFLTPCNLYDPHKMPFSNCSATRIHALQNNGFCTSSQVSPRLSFEIFPGNSHNENCQLKYNPSVQLDDKSSSTEESDHYQALKNDFACSANLYPSSSHYVSQNDKKDSVNLYPNFATEEYVHPNDKKEYFNDPLSGKNNYPYERSISKKEPLKCISTQTSLENLHDTKPLSFSGDIYKSYVNVQQDEESFGGRAHYNKNDIRDPLLIT